MPDITLHRSTLDAEHWLALVDGSLVAEGAYKDVKQAATLAAAPRGRVSIGTPISKAPGSMAVHLQKPPTVDTGKGIGGKGIGKKGGPSFFGKKRPGSDDAPKKGKPPKDGSSTDGSSER